MSKKDSYRVFNRLREIIRHQSRFAPQAVGVNPERSQEIRLGLVMYGGVSLAIYIFGVAQEFFRAVRGRGVYRLLKDLTDSDVVVDVMSGTSAGGVNGIQLGYALANERELSDCNPLWRDAGDLMRLIHEPNKPPEAVRSVLDSDFYLKRMLGGLRDMRAITETEELPSRGQEIDLFITSTDVDGDAYTWIDDAGHTVDVKDHRAVFVLKHRLGRKTPFATDDVTERALAKLARMTSCFPVAFEPVTVNAADPDPVDAKLVEWGKLDPRRRQFFLDGGVLDNKPFTYTLREIFYRMAHRKVDRKLFYVDPDPERFENRVISEHAPSVPAAALKSLVSIPGYESIAEDLKLLSEHNGAVSRFKRMTKAFDEKPAPELAKIDARLYNQARYLQLSERAVRGILHVDGRHALLDRERAEAGQRLYRAFDDWEGPADTLLDFDIYFRLRRVFDLVYRIEPPPPGGDPWPRGGLLWLLGRQVKLLEIIQVGMERVLDNTPFAWKDREPEAVWADVQAAFKFLLDAPGLLPEGYAKWEGESWLEQPVLAGVNTTLIERGRNIREAVAQGGALAPPAKFRSALVVTDTCERDIVQAMSASNDPDLKGLGSLLETYEGFENVDAQIFPMQVFSGVHEKDIVRTVRISPFDAQRGYSRRPGEDKISGDALHHFGGFLKRSWRSNDIMWGRMDGLCQLIEGLFTPLRLAEVSNSPLGSSIAAKLANPEYLQKIFPTTPKKDLDALRTELQRVFEKPLPYDKRHPEEVDKEFRERFEFPKLLERLIHAGQREILEKEVPHVLDLGGVEPVPQVGGGQAEFARSGDAEVRRRQGRAVPRWARGARRACHRGRRREARAPGGSPAGRGSQAGGEG